MDTLSPIFRFGPFELRTGSRQLFKLGTQVRLRGQPYLILELLLQRPGAVVTREEICNALWTADTFVDFEHGLNTSVKKLRQLLCDSPIDPRYIETLPRMGYRFIAPVEMIGTEPKLEEAQEVLQTQAPEPVATAALQVVGSSSVVVDRHVTTPKRLRMLWPRFASTAGLAIISLLGLKLALQFGWLGAQASPGQAAASVTPAIRSIAVLPLQNLSNDPSQDYFADGMSDELITDLAQLGSLKVISRTSTIQYKGTKKVVPQIGRELGADALVEGSVERDGKRVRIRVQLLESATDRHLWARSYDRNLSDILALQTKAAHDIAEEIQGHVVSPQLTRAVSIRPIKNEAYDAYLKGKYFFNQRSPAALQKSITYYKDAIREDPEFGAPYAGLADVYSILGSDVLPAKEAREKAQAAVHKALELDPGMAEGHATLGLLEFYYDWNWTKAEEEFRLAIRLNPNYATAHQWYSGYLTAFGRFQEAVDEANVARQLDPLSLAINTTLASKYYYSGDYEEAVKLNRRSIELDPNFLPAHLALASEYAAQGKWPEAFQEANAAISLSNNGTAALVKLGQLYASSGKRAEAEKIIRILESRSPQQFVSPFDMAEIYASMNNRDETFRWLEKSYAEHESRLPFLKVDKHFATLATDPRFQELLRRIGLTS